MTEDELKNLRDALQNKTFWVKSMEADFEKGTWTFRTPGVRVSGGTYVLISASEWQHFWELEQVKLWAPAKPQR